MSRQLAVDFIEKKPFSLRYVSGISLALLLLGLVLAVYVYQQYQTAIQANEVAQAALSAVEPQAKNVQVEKEVTKPALSKAELKQAQKTAALLDIQWQALFSGLEELKMRHVALLSIAPNVKKQRLVLTGQGKNMQAILDYVAHVEALPMLSRVHLQKHQVEKETPYQPITFTIVARWI